MARVVLIPRPPLLARKAFGGCNPAKHQNGSIPGAVCADRVHARARWSRLRGPGACCSSGPAHVGASASIDPDQFTFFNKQGDLNHFTGL
jgi:hypothetical protein